MEETNKQNSLPEAIPENQPSEEEESFSLFKNSKGKGRFGGSTTNTNTSEPKPTLTTASKATQCIYSIIMLSSVVSNSARDWLNLPKSILLFQK